METSVSFNFDCIFNLTGNIFWLLNDNNTSEISFYFGWWMPQIGGCPCAVASKKWQLFIPINYLKLKATCAKRGK